MSRETADLVSLFDVDIVGSDLPSPSWNIAPTQSISVVIDSLPRSTEPDDFPEPTRRLEAARWGLVPASARDPKSGPSLFNAPSEGAVENASFRTAVMGRRAVIPSSGYYEWKIVGDTRVPHFVSLPGDELLLFAGLYEWWRNPSAIGNSADKWLLSATILTRRSSGALAALNERMPVFLDADLVEEWLDPQEEGSQELVDHVAEAAEFVEPRARFFPVGAAVESAQSEGPELVRPLA